MKSSVVPGISSVVYLAGKLGVSWEDAYLASISRKKSELCADDRAECEAFLLLGGKGNGAEVCGKIREYDLNRLTFWIGRNLSYPEEEISQTGRRSFVRKIWRGCVRYWYKMSSRISADAEEAFRMRNGSAEKFR